MAGLILGGYRDDGWGDLALVAADLFHLWQIGAAGKRAHAAARARSGAGSRKT